MPTYTNNTGTSQVVPNLAGNNVVVGAGESVQTYRILGTGWTKTNDEPYFALARVRGSITSPGTVSGLVTDRYLQVLTDADGITVKANVAANPNEYPLQKGVPYYIDNADGVIDALVFVGDGAVTVVGMDR
jgi:hypothetical protein